MQRAQPVGKPSQSNPDMPIVQVGISDQEFLLIRNLVYERFGINLTEEKRALVIARLGKLLRSRGFKNFKAYYDHLLADSTGSALDSLANSISTNFTFFYRESEHFEIFLSTVLPEMDKRISGGNERDLRLWCAGCSSGQEPYTLQMLIREYFGQRYALWEAGLLATDISARALETAMRGVYPAETLDRLPRPLVLRYFSKAAGREYGVTDEIKKDVTFRRFNLMNERFPFRKPFHIIFCRNVMIYFDADTQARAAEKLTGNLEPGGYLFVGHAESLSRRPSSLEYVQPAVYRKPAERGGAWNR